jgi:hypothetical protein
VLQQFPSCAAGSFCLTKVNNNGYEPEILVARRTNPGVVDTFQATVCLRDSSSPRLALTRSCSQVSYYTACFPNASYSLLTSQLTYPVSDSASGKTAYIVGGQTSNAISIVPNVS